MSFPIGPVEPNFHPPLDCLKPQRNPVSGDTELALQTLDLSPAALLIQVPY